MSDYGSNNSVFNFDMFHTSANAIEGKNKRLSFPEPEKGAKEGEMKE